MGKRNARYCVRVNPPGKWQIWDRKMAKWWGNGAWSGERQTDYMTRHKSQRRNSDEQRQPEIAEHSDGRC